MIRVVHYIGELQFGGSQSFVMEIYRKIDREEMQFDFVTFPGERGKGFYDEIISLGGRVYEAPRYNGKNHFVYKNWWKNFWMEHPEYKIFHTHVRSVAAICIPIAKKFGCVTIAHSHSTSNGSGISAIVKAIMQLPIRYQADYLFACSQKAGQWLYGRKAIQKDNYRVIPNAIDTEKFRFNEEIRNEIRKEFSLENKFVIGHVGRMVEPKNHSFLLDIFFEVQKTRDDAVLMLIGDGPLRNEIEEKCKKFNISEKVCFLGSRSEIWKYYNAMDVFVFPSLWEGLPVTVVEAQAAGLISLISENITNEVMISDLVKKLPIDTGVEIWRKALLITADKRADVSKTIIDSGFDISESAKMIFETYRGLIHT